MKLKANTFTAMLLGLTLVACSSADTTTSTAVPVYSSIPDPLPPNLPSQAFQATQTAEFGDYIKLAPGTGRQGTEAIVAMSNWSPETAALGGAKADATGFDWPITLNIYGAPSAGDPTVPGALIKSFTQTFHIPWRPGTSSDCPDPTYQWKAANGKCYGGIAFTITFDLTVDGGITLPDSFVYGIAFNTQSWGSAPTNQEGPYTGLNVARSNDANAPTVGANAGTPDTVFWNTGSGTAGVMSGFREMAPQGDTAPFYMPAVEFLAR
jgi:hypothetical protein